jgi:integrase|tara:strand:- start:1015 stop:2190 length:1176 start_codon:yes stop_codon:yes gene_type:complete
MATIYKHPKGYNIRYFFVLPDGGRIQKDKYSKVKTKADRIRKDVDLLETLASTKNLTRDDLEFYVMKKYLNNSDVDRLTGQTGYSLKNTFQHYANMYDTYSVSAHSARTRSTSLTRLKTLANYFEDIPMSDISADTILKYQEKRLKENMSPQTIQHERNVLSIMLDMAFEDDVVRFNPVKSRRLKGTLTIDRSRLPKAMTFSEVELLFELIKKDKEFFRGYIYPATLLFLFAGLRRQEAVFLENDDLVNKKVLVHGKVISGDETTDRDVRQTGSWNPKSNQARSVEIPFPVYEIINEQPKKERFFFGGEKTWDISYFSDCFGNILKKINPVLHLHTLRHTFVTWRLQYGLSGTGDNLLIVKNQAGHSKIETTMRYTHIKEKLDGNILELVQ